MTTSLLLFVHQKSPLIPTNLLSDEGDYTLSLPKMFSPQYLGTIAPRAIVRSNNYAQRWFQDNWYQPQRICVVGDEVRLLAHVQVLSTSIPRHRSHLLSIPKILTGDHNSSIRIQIEQDEELLPGFGGPRIVIFQCTTRLGHVL